MDENVKVGTYEGTAAAMTLEIGFAPHVMLVINSEDMDVFSVWTSDMTAGYGWVMDATPAQITTGYTTYAGTSVPATLTGTVTVTAGDATVTGSSTLFTTETRVGDIIKIGTQTRKILDITSATVCTVSEVWDTAAAAVAVYRETGRQAGVTIGTDTTGFNESGKTYTYIAFK